jgi:alkylhydroperoxidase/carboxymuconolactone decarboxylase family protein YurZ
MWMENGGLPGAGDPQANGLWGPALEKLREWDSAWAENCLKLTKGRADAALPVKFLHLVGVALNAARTSPNPEATRRYIRAALAAGAGRDEILMVLKVASTNALHALALGAPILVEEGQAIGATPVARPAIPTPASDRLRALKEWNYAWDLLAELDPTWTEAFMAVIGAVHGTGLFTAKDIELISVALDASKMYGLGTRRHISAALQAGATIEEVLDVLELCVAQGMQACNIGVPILAEELERAQSVEPDPDAGGE